MASKNTSGANKMVVHTIRTLIINLNFESHVVERAS